MSFRRSLCLGLSTILGWLPLALAQPAPSAQPSFCAVEIGSRGVKGRAFSLAQGDGKDRRSVETVLSKDVNTNIVASMEGTRFSRRGIEEAAAAVASLLTEMRAALPGCQVFVVGSSGISVATNLDDLVAEVGTRSGGTRMEVVTSEQESRFGFMGSIPRKDWDSTAFLDIGSGNTKLSALVGKEIKLIDIPFGAVTLTKAAASKGIADFGAAVDRTIDADVRPAFKMSASRSPMVLNRPNVVVIGGSAWALSTVAHPESVRRSFVKLTREDLQKLRGSLEDRSWTEAKTPFYSTTQTKQVFAEEMKKIVDTFTRDNLLAGHGLLRMVVDDLGRDGRIYFARQGNWLFGYVQDRYAAELWGKSGIEEHL